MPSDRFFIEQPPAGGSVRLSREESHHLRHVRRLRVGDNVVLFDGSGADYVGRVSALDRAGATVEILQTERPDREPAVAVTLAVSVVKSHAMHQMIDQCTQLGVRRLIPLRTERSAVRVGRNAAERWRRIAIEACKQCGRSRLPEIAEATTLARVLEEEREFDARLVASLRAEEEGQTAFFRGAKKVICPSFSSFSVLCLIGPEGGFTEAEETAAVSAGCLPVSLGGSILRTETAAVTALVLATRT